MRSRAHASWKDPVGRVGSLFRAMSVVVLAGLIPHAASVRAEVLAGRVVRISDGDTLTVLVGRQQVKVRLDAIDAPEIAQPFGERARRSLSSLCAGRPADVQVHGRDRYGRALGDAQCEGRSAREFQLSAGMAWVYPQYAPADSPLYELEAEARLERRGLWQDPDPVPPWGWRKARRER